MSEHTIAENLARLQNAATAISEAIVAKGGTVAEGDGLEEFATDIANIPSGSGVELSNDPPEFTLLKNIRNLNVVVPNGITSIDSNAFENCSGLESITMPRGVTAIGQRSFYYCSNLTSIDLSDVTTILAEAFLGCTKLTSVSLRDDLTTLGYEAFRACSSLSSINIPASLTQIPSSAFRQCSSLLSIDIPSGITSIGAYAFASCSGLTNIKFHSPTPPTVSNSNAWSGIPRTCIIYVPTGSLSDYTSASNYPSSSTYTYVEY